MSERSPLAIVGYAYRAPGVGRKGLWEFLEEGKSAWSPIPCDRFNQDAYHHPNAEKPGFISSEGAHFLPDDIYTFDPSFFKISTEEAHYKLWDLMRSDPSMWSLRIEGMTLKRLYYLHEMTRLTQSIGQGEVQVPPPMFPDEPPDSVHSINSRISEKRIVLGQKVWARIQEMSQQIFGQDAEDPIIFAKHEGSLDFVVMWDHWHDSLRDVVGHQSISTFRPDPAFEKKYLWNDSSDEEM